MESIKTGLFENMSDAEYFAYKAINASTLKKMHQSPADAYATIYGEYKEPSPAMKLGTAYHKLFLEGKRAFKRQYAIPFDAKDYPDALDTVDDLKNQCKEFDIKVQGKKVDYINALLDAGFEREKILQCVKDDHFYSIGDKEVLNVDIYNQLLRDYEVFKKYSALKKMLRRGKAETVAICQGDNGQLWKAKIDFITHDGWVIDVKTLAPQGIDFRKACLNHIRNYKYHMQAYWYAMVLHRAIEQMVERPAWLPKEIKGFKFLAIRKDGTPDFISLEFKPKDAEGHFYSYWRKAEADVYFALEQLNAFEEKFGKNTPWLSDSEVVLTDEHFPNYFLEEENK